VSKVGLVHYTDALQAALIHRPVKYAQSENSKHIAFNSNQFAALVGQQPWIWALLNVAEGVIIMDSFNPMLGGDLVLV